VPIGHREELRAWRSNPRRIQRQCCEQSRGDFSQTTPEVLARYPMPINAAKHKLYRAIVDKAAQSYIPVGRGAYHFARAKLRYDPVFAAILARGLLRDGVRLADLGCGEGLLFALLIAAHAQYDKNAWPEGWPPPARPVSLLGIDLRRSAIRAAEIAVGDRARVSLDDIRTAAIPECDAIVLLDVLHYLTAPEQEAVLAKCRAALSPEGLLLLRIGDADAHLRFWITKIVDQIGTTFRNAAWPPMHCRGLSEWTKLLDRLDLRVQAEPMSAGTPYANVLLIARPRR
jgi:SAM-dependent methyltransferase